MYIMKIPCLRSTSRYRMENVSMFGSDALKDAENIDQS